MGFLKYFQPQVIETIQSPVSGQIKVIKDLNSVYFSTGMWTQTGGIIYDLWGPTLKKLQPKKDSSWLILGLSGGTVAQIISKKYSPSKIVGVEIDPIMIALGKKYLQLGDIPHLQIIQQDAKRYVSYIPIGLKYDYVLVDMYVGDSPPKFIFTSSFLKQLKKIGGVCVVNQLFYTPDQKKSAEKMVEVIGKIYDHVQLFHRLTNMMIIAN